LQLLGPTFTEPVFSGRMDTILTMSVAMFGVVGAIGAALRSSIGRNGLLADPSLRYREREELGLGGAGRSIRSATPKYR